MHPLNEYMGRPLLIREHGCWKRFNVVACKDTMFYLYVTVRGVDLDEGISRISATETRQHIHVPTTLAEKFTCVSS